MVPSLPLLSCESSVSVKKTLIEQKKQYFIEFSNLEIIGNFKLTFSVEHVLMTASGMFYIWNTCNKNRSTKITKIKTGPSAFDYFYKGDGDPYAFLKCTAISFKYIMLKHSFFLCVCVCVCVWLCVCVCVRVCVGDFLFLFNLCDTAFEFKRTLFIIRRINKSLKFLGHSLRLELNLLLKLLLEMRDALTKEKLSKLKIDSYV